MKDAKRVAHPDPAHGKTWCWSWGTLSAVSVEITSVRLSVGSLKFLPTSRALFMCHSTLPMGGNRPSGENSKRPASKLTGAKRWGRTDGERNHPRHHPARSEEARRLRFLDNQVLVARQPWRTAGKD